MAYEPKTWNYNDIITENELNRMEQGIANAHQISEQAQITADSHASRHATGGPDEITPVMIGAAAASDLASHLNDDVRHVTQNEKNNWNNAVITDMGSNANGNYVRWANGLQICWGMNQGVNTPLATQWNYETVTLPASFYDSSYTVTLSYFGFPGVSHGYWQKYAVESRTTTEFRIVEAVQLNATTALRYFWVAIGRWK